jgi:hypothetical protein
LADTTTDDATLLARMYGSVLAGMRKAGPKELQPRVAVEAADAGVPANGLEARLRDHLAQAELDDALRRDLHLAIAEWDFAPTDAAWTKDTKPNTAERRDAIYEALGLEGDTRRLLDEIARFATDNSIVISRDFEAWYTDDVQRERDYYWEHYRTYLANVARFDVDAIAAIDASTTLVLQRLARPTRSNAYQARGLVLGYVQSGKTANFTGVIAKAVDAGYRLIVVLTGTTNLLRSQTQRRVDKELVGVENILRRVDKDDPTSLEGVDYQGDPDWLDGAFVRHTGSELLPSDLNRPDILRLTSYQTDYRGLNEGITTLELERRDGSKSLYDPDNLFRTNARLIVIKKNKAPMKKVVKDLKRIAPQLNDIPTLIIDDESDQASVNTLDPKTWEKGRKERTAINELISDLLRLLPRAQYVGYTATPFANVFVDPTDAEDIFPRDFIFSLARAPGYMGATDFHDLDNPVPQDERTIANSNEKAYVRSISQKHGEAGRLREALDAFVLTGAVKLYREEHGLGAGYFRHHTMLIHESAKIAEHAALAARVQELWANAGYNGKAGLNRLRDLYETDIAPVSEARAPEDATLVAFDDLKPHVAKAISKINAGANPVLVVNSDAELASEAVDFEKRPVWRVLIGGTKLSRGFTVEGLTISYYRRKTQQADTLMQMGRWFGFRSNYQDLVRLYIGRNEGHGGMYDLYEAFEAACVAEERFRDQLQLYATLEDGRPQITPRDVPPLVTQHLPWLRPAAPNKMFNAQLVERRSPGRSIEPSGYPLAKDDLKHNTGALMPLIRSADKTMRFAYKHGDRMIPYDALVGEADHKSVISALAQMRWQAADHFAPDLRWLSGLRPEEVDRWIVMLPQHAGKGPRATVDGHGPLSVFRRQRRTDRGPVFGYISDPKHRATALRIAGATESFGDPHADTLHRARTGALLIYPAVEASAGVDIPGALHGSDVVTAFMAVAPSGVKLAGGRFVTFTVRDPERDDEPIVDLHD